MWRRFAPVFMVNDYGTGSLQCTVGRHYLFGVLKNLVGNHWRKTTYLFNEPVYLTFSPAFAVTLVFVNRFTQVSLRVVKFTAKDTIATSRTNLCEDADA